MWPHILTDGKAISRDQNIKFFEAGQFFFNSVSAASNSIATPQFEHRYCKFWNFFKSFCKSVKRKMDQEVHQEDISNKRQTENCPSHASLTHLLLLHFGLIPLWLCCFSSPLRCSLCGLFSWCVCNSNEQWIAQHSGGQRVFWLVDWLHTSHSPASKPWMNESLLQSSRPTTSVSFNTEFPTSLPTVYKHLLYNSLCRKSFLTFMSSLTFSRHIVSV